MEKRQLHNVAYCILLGAINNQTQQPEMHNELKTTVLIIVIIFLSNFQQTYELASFRRVCYIHQDYIHQEEVQVSNMETYSLFKTAIGVSG